MSDTTAVIIACIVPLVCLLVIGLIVAGVVYWFVSQKKSKEQGATPTTDTPEQMPTTTSAPAPVEVKQEVSHTARNQPSLSENEINQLVWGLWADEDPTEADFRDAMRFAGQYRNSCERKLRELGKEAIPYLEPYAARKEVAPLLEELKKL